MIFQKKAGGELKINVSYNNTLSQERKKLEEFIKPYSNNIIILYIDSVSRSNSVRKLKKTLSFIEKFMPYKGLHNEKDPYENFHSFQFFKYHSFFGYTPQNYPVLFYGNDRSSKKVLLTKYLKKNGYITCYASDLCAKEVVRTYQNFTLDEVFDHQFVLCDPNKQHIYENSIKCLYGKIDTEHLYEYGDQFWRKYKDNRKYLQIVTNEGHEGSLESLKYIDNTLYNFLENLFNDNFLKETSILFLSDHGVGTASIYYLYDFYKFEKRLPMLYIIMNDRKNISYSEQYKYLHKNQQTFITGYDIYNTIINIIYGDKYFLIKNKFVLNETRRTKFSKSLFEDINQKERKPQLFNMSEWLCVENK